MLSSSGQLGKYRLLRRVGVGGMAEVYEAELSGAAGFCKRLAVKIMLPHCQQEPELVRAFIDEASIVARLSHPSIVPVFDFGEIDGTYFLAMEYVDGWDLAQVLRRCRQVRQRLPTAASAYVVAQLAEALHYVHTRDDAIVHRDVTPHNIFLTRQGHVRLADFGVAKAAARLSRTASGFIKGKLAYLAPEQVAGEQMGPRGDVYAAGLVLFELLTGQRFNPGASEVELLRHAQHPVFRPPSRLAPEAAPLDQVVRGALQKHPAQRTRDAALLAEHLDQFLEQHPFGASDLAVLLQMLEQDRPAGPIAEAGPADALVGQEPVPAEATGAARFFEEQPTQKDVASGLRPLPSTETQALSPPLQTLPSSETQALSPPPPTLSSSETRAPAGPLQPASSQTRSLVSSLHRRRWPWLLASAAALSSGLLLISGWRPWSRPPGQASSTIPAATSPGPDAAPALVPASRPALATATADPARPGSLAPLPPRSPAAREGRETTARRPRRRPRHPVASEPAVKEPVAKVKPALEPSVVPAPLDRGAGRRRLQELQAMARGRGLWPGDDAELDRQLRRAREAVEREGGEPELRRLAEWLDRFRIDQAFIKRKLGRLEQEVNRPGRSEEQRRQLSLGTQEVLKLVLANQLVEASRRISSLLAR